MVIKSKPFKKNRYYFYLYKTTCLKNNKVYIGVHQTKNLNDGYIGSGVMSQAYAESYLRYYEKHNKKSAFIRAVVKYGYSSFKTEILQFFNSRVEMINKEKEIVNKNWVNNENNYNILVGGIGGGNKKLTKEQESSVYKKYMLGNTWEDLCKEYKVSKSVIYKTLKHKNKKGRILPKSRVDKWIDKNKDKYIELYRNNIMSKDEINNNIPIYLWRNDFLKGIKRKKKYICITPKGDTILFDGGKELSEKL